MGRVIGCLIVAALVALPAKASGAEDTATQEAASLERALRTGKFSLELRPRYNHIEESSKPLRAEGGTLRAVAGWRMAPYGGWRATVEAIHADHLGPKRYNDDPARLTASPYPLLPDPRHTGLNRAQLEGTAAGVRLVLGRQRLRLDNERWVSDNDFRQIPQLFDGAAATWDVHENAELMAGHYRRMRNTSGRALDLRLTVVHAAWNPGPGHAVAAYGYFHDQPQNGAFTGFADNSYRVAGLRAEGAFVNLRGLDLPYVLEAARQRPYAGGDASIDAVYRRAGAGLAQRHWTVRYDYEVKGSNEGRYGLQMPLTDFYGFNGWTLHFFNTPRQGLRDRWLTARVAFGGATLYAEEHRFRSDFGRADLGRETDVGLGWVHADVALRLQHGRYSPGAGGGASVRKTWLTLEYAY